MKKFEIKIKIISNINIIRTHTTMNSKHSDNSSKRMVARTRKPRGEKRHRTPPRKNYPTKPRDLDKREKLKTSRSRTSEFAHLYAYDFSGLTHEWIQDELRNRHLQEPYQDQDTHYFVTIDNVKKPYYGIISVCDGFEDRYYTSIRV